MLQLHEKIELFANDKEIGLLRKLFIEKISCKYVIMTKV